jgi:hypothetical protein
MGRLLAGIDVLLWIAAVTQLLLVILGATVSLQDEWAKKHKVMILIFFIVLGVTGLWATLVQSARSVREATEASGKLSTALGTLGTSTLEISRMTTLNTKLQGQLIAQSEALVVLTKLNAASSSRIEKTTVDVRAQISLLAGRRQQGEAWVKLTTKLTDELRMFATNWEYGELDSLQKSKYSELFEMTPALQGPERTRREQMFDDKIDSANDKQKEHLAKILIDAQALQEALLAELPARTGEEKQKDMEEQAITAEPWRYPKTVYTYANCCIHFQELASYLDNLALQVKLASK